MTNKTSYFGQPRICYRDNWELQLNAQIVTDFLQHSPSDPELISNTSTLSWPARKGTACVSYVAVCWSLIFAKVASFPVLMSCAVLLVTGPVSRGSNWHLNWIMLHETRGYGHGVMNHDLSFLSGRVSTVVHNLASPSFYWGQYWWESWILLNPWLVMPRLWF